jgi:hypothetical protein
MLDLLQEVCVPRRAVLFEGLSEEEILNLPQPECEGLILLGDTFRAAKART